MFLLVGTILHAYDQETIRPLVARSGMLTNTPAPNSSYIRLVERPAVGTDKLEQGYLLVSTQRGTKPEANTKEATCQQVKK
jgi:hypothetical protein